MFAHGFEVGPEPYEHLCRTWAAAGYVVAAPEFPLTDAAVAGSALDETDVVNQPDDLAFVAHSLVTARTDGLPRIDPDEIAVAGHSDGAETALSVALGHLMPVRGVIAMSGAPLARDSGPNPPLLAVQGDADPVNPPAEGFAVYEQASPPRFLVRLLGAGHLPPFAGATVWQPVVDRVTTDFLDRYVSGRAPNANLLAAGAPALAVVSGSP
jgi:predicted dienelactone hydrolase